MIIAYDRSSAVSYALKWALRRNEAYFNFDGLGGDCTNFVSQCLYAGSKTMNYTPTFGWYFISLNSRSPSWSGVNYFYEFLETNKELGPFGKVVAKENAEVGDFIQLGTFEGNFYHTLIITEITSGRIFVSAHTNNALNIPLSNYLYEKKRIIHIEGVFT